MNLFTYMGLFASNAFTELVIRKHASGYFIIFFIVKSIFCCGKILKSVLCAHYICGSFKVYENTGHTVFISMPGIWSKYLQDIGFDIQNG